MHVRSFALAITFPNSLETKKKEEVEIIIIGSVMILIMLQLCYSAYWELL